MMLTFQEASERILSNANFTGTQEVLLTEVLHCVSAEDVIYDINMPPFNKSAMDGYACARADINKELIIIETIYAGKETQTKLQPGQCAKIMTGAPLPEGADMVFMQEDAELTSEGKVRCTNQSSKTNICYLGEDIKAGDTVIPKKTILQPKHMPLIAGAGYAQISVAKKPKVSIIVTGTELVEPNEKPKPYQIRNSNASQIIGQLQSISLNYNYKGILKDDEEVLRSHITQTLKGCDVLIMSGGVSVGEFDLIPQILKDSGFHIEVDKTAIQPGKPMVFAHGNGKYVFGLSGNPVASFIQFELYVKPFLFALQGCNYQPMRFQLPLKNEFKRYKSSRYMFVPAQITEDNEIEPLKFHGSAHIGALCYADCLMEIPIGAHQVQKGDMVYIRPL